MGLLIHPHRRDAALEASLVAWAEQHLRQLLTVSGSAKEWTTSEALDCDRLRRDIVASRGYVAEPESDYFVTTRARSRGNYQCQFCPTASAYGLLRAYTKLMRFKPPMVARSGKRGNPANPANIFR